MAAIRDVFSNGTLVTQDEAIRELAHELGYGGLGPVSRKSWARTFGRPSGVAFFAVKRVSINWIATRSTTNTRDDLVKYLMAAMCETWWDQGRGHPRWLQQISHRQVHSCLT